MSGILNRYPFNSPWIRGMVTKWGLALWFALLVLPTVFRFLAHSPVLFFDAQLYLDATRVWLNGGDPWTVARNGFLFAAPPPTLVLLVPFALLPGDLGWLALGFLCIAGAVATVRMLSLPWWWLLFPPTVMAMLDGNVQALLLPLILARSGWAAGLLKVYGIVPDAILGRWRQVAAFGVILVVTAPLLPWAQFLAEFGAINAALAGQSNQGFPAIVSVLLAPPALLAMWIVGRERSAWLAVPALWPSQQWYYATLALPTRSAIVGFVISLPLAGSGTLALFVLAGLELWGRRRRRHAKAVGPATTLVPPPA